ncbi:MAG: host-nuclease inhibitor Gam family protein [Longimicrobiales bacterium]
MADAARDRPEIVDEIEREEDDFLRRIGLADDVKRAEIALEDAGEDEEVRAVERNPELDSRIDALLERIAERRAEIRESEEVEERRVQMIRDHFKGERYSLEASVEYLENKVRLLALGGYDFKRKKSRNLPHGTFGFRATRPTVEVVNEERAVKWAGSAVPEAVKVTRSVLKTPILDALTDEGVLAETGEVLDAEEHGVRFVPGDARGTFYVKPKE